MVVSTFARGGGALAIGVVFGTMLALIGGGAALARAQRRAVSRESRRAAGRRRLRRARGMAAAHGRSRAAARPGASRGARRASRAGWASRRCSRSLLSSVVSGSVLVLGVVADDALGLTPVVFLLAGLLFVVTIATYVEGNSLHPERGGASTFARYAFDELWSFIAGWAILLDYLIVMAIGAVAISDYLAAFWDRARRGRHGDRRSPARRSLFVASRTCAASRPTGSARSCALSLLGSCCSAW